MTSPDVEGCSTHEQLPLEKHGRRLMNGLWLEQIALIEVPDRSRCRDVVVVRILQREVSRNVCVCPLQKILDPPL
jgi:hypothetical protein